MSKDSKEIEVVDHYEIYLPKERLEGWREKIAQGESLPPELLGFLIGCAYPVYGTKPQTDKAPAPKPPSKKIKPITFTRAGER